MLGFEEEHPRNKRERRATPSTRANKQARLPIPVQGRAGQMGEGESREGLKDWRISEGSKRLLQRRADVQQASKLALRTPNRSQETGHFISNTETLEAVKNLNKSLAKRTHPSQEEYLFPRFSYILVLTF